MVQIQTDFNVEFQGGRLAVADTSIMDDTSRRTAAIPRLGYRLFFLSSEGRASHDTLVKFIGFLWCAFEFDTDDGHEGLLQCNRS